MSVETVRPEFGEHYFAAGALVFNVGCIQEFGGQGYRVGNGPVTDLLRQMDYDEIEARGIIFEKNFFARRGNIEGTLTTEDRVSSLTQTDKALIVRKEVADGKIISAEITGHMSNPVVSSVKVETFFKEGNRHESRIGRGAAAQRIGTSVLSRVVNEFHSRLTTD